MANKGKKKKKIKKIKKKNLLLALGAVAFIIIVIIVFIIPKHSTSGHDLTYNKNDSFLKEQKVEGIVFKNIECSYDGKDSLISYTIVNETKDKVYLNNYDIIVKDKNNVRLTKIAAHVTQTLNPKKSIKMADQVVGIDLTDAYYMELKLNTNKKEK